MASKINYMKLLRLIFCTIFFIPIYLVIFIIRTMFGFLIIWGIINLIAFILYTLQGPDYYIFKRDAFSTMISMFKEFFIPFLDIKKFIQTGELVLN